MKTSIPRIALNGEEKQLRAISVASSSRYDEPPSRTASSESSRFFSIAPTATLASMGRKRRMSEAFLRKMVSTRTLTWTCVLMQLVGSCVCLIASLAVISAKLNSVSIYPDKQYVSIEWWSFCVLSLLMIVCTVGAMIGLSNHKKPSFCRIFFAGLSGLRNPHITKDDVDAFLRRRRVSRFQTTDSPVVAMSQRQSDNASKGPLLACFVAQIVISTFAVAENVVVMRIPEHEFVLPETKTATMITGTFFIVYVFCSFFALCALFANSSLFIYVHLFFSLVMETGFAAMLAVMVAVQPGWPVQLLIFVLNLAMILTIYYEFKFLRVLKKLST
ncbi:unnamed protein product [Caenorhabditis auriculariae]|uniref:Transmembrane protein n=1 Tax=Caenorhabditis auriculariae TaxID=2777116 RepID=A0A8S1HAI0_9PELO|nr:unnamed protein product [Caenorhabditis auriculariae]